jgi:hypothetical protein
MIESGIDVHDIIFVIGGTHKLEKLISDEGVELLFVDYNSFDVNGLICIAENLDKYTKHDNFFLLHDTCEVLPYFKEQSEKFANTDLVKPLCDNISMNIGMYSRKCLLDECNFLKSLKFYPVTTSDLQTVKTFFVINEDILFKKYKQPNIYYNTKWNVVNESVNFYNIGNTNRTIELFEDIGLIKIKANTRTKSVWDVDL